MGFHLAAAITMAAVVSAVVTGGGFTLYENEPTRIAITAGAAHLTADQAVAATAEPEGPHVLFEDSFDAQRLDADWHWLRKDPQSWRLREEGLEIRVQPGRGETVKNVLWREAGDRTKDAYAVEVTVTTLEPPTTQWEQAGLILYREGAPVIKLGKELVDGQLCIIPGETPMDAQTVRLRLSVHGEQFVAQYQPDAKGDFKTAATGRFGAPGRIPAAGKLPVEEGSGDQVSLQCFEGPADAEHWVRFDDFRLIRIDHLPEVID